AETVRGPVCILAGAGSGKTTTITRRIAHQVASSAFAPGEILAVTFTDKAAGEMRARLAALGVQGVAARTFHSAALAQLRHFAPGSVGQILPTKALELRHIANRLLRAPYKFRPAADLATEIEWAQNRRIRPEHYLEATGDREPPIPAELMHRIYCEYEARKRSAGLIDFEDLLELAIGLYDSDPHATEVFRARYRAFTVDEYQDVNDLQQTLLERWLGPREELCVVGDDYQSIYSFTGASPGWLLGFAERFPAAKVVRLEANYRSSPELLELANKLVPRLAGAEKTLRATQPSGPPARAQMFVDYDAEAKAVVERIKELHKDGVPLEEMALLVRTNARAADFEEGLADAKIPFQGASLLGRESARFLVKRLRGSNAPLAEEVRRLAQAQGWLEDPPEKLGEREQTRQADLGRLVRMAAELDDGVVTGADYVAWLEQRFDPRAAGSGVHLLTYHRAKGLEFEAVFLPRLEDKELPSKRAVKAGGVVEERRLFYVGLTRAKRELWLSWTAKGKASRFLIELDVVKEMGVDPFAKPRDEDLPPAYAALKEWRLKRSKADGVPAYVVFHDRTLVEIAERQPRNEAELSTITGVGPAKLERYGQDVLAALAS
ncbi:MAG: ATP-dependent helicase UvrD/PcrA, partial [Gaiellaceae bacterium]|nr:ATP-dependent helicase UvrD/PcrA [Gaiellaceae bacterium]